MIDLSFSPSPLDCAVENYRKAALSANTHKTYGIAWKKFESWCNQEGEPCLPTTTETIARYLAAIGATTKFTALQTVISAIKHRHREAQLEISGPPSTYQAVYQGVRRSHPENQGCKPKPHISFDLLCEVIPTIPDTLKGKRDRAMILLAFFTGCRRSEIVALDVEHLEQIDGNLRVSVMSSKTSDTVHHLYVDAMPDYPLCPVAALNEWKGAANISEGAVFLSFCNSSFSGNRIRACVVAEVIKQYFGAEYAAHSTRSGMTTEMAASGMPMHEVMALSRHKSADCALRYMRSATGFDHTVAKGMKKGRLPR
jgi:site-specific recombinase XerD